MKSVLYTKKCISTLGIILALKKFFGGLFISTKKKINPSITELTGCNQWGKKRRKDEPFMVNYKPIRRTLQSFWLVKIFFGKGDYIIPFLLLKGYKNI